MGGRTRTAAACPLLDGTSRLRAGRPEEGAVDTSGERYYRKIERSRTIDISDAARPEGSVLEIRFIECTITGPGVVRLLPPCELDDCSCVDPADVCFVEAPEGPLPAGMIPVQGCRFERCVFDGVTFAVSNEDERRWIEKGIAFAAP
jgi:hypothetical protein